MSNTVLPFKELVTDKVRNPNRLSYSTLRDRARAAKLVAYRDPTNPDKKLRGCGIEAANLSRIVQPLNPGRSTAGRLAAANASKANTVVLFSELAKGDQNLAQMYYMRAYSRKLLTFKYPTAPKALKGAGVLGKDVDAITVNFKRTPRTFKARTTRRATRRTTTPVVAMPGTRNSVFVLGPKAYLEAVNTLRNLQNQKIGIDEANKVLGPYQFSSPEYRELVDVFTGDLAI